MEERTYTLNIRQTGTYQYEVTIPETGVTKTAATLDSALTITLTLFSSISQFAISFWCSMINVLTGTISVSTHTNACTLIWSTRPLVR